MKINERGREAGLQDSVTTAVLIKVVLGLQGVCFLVWAPASFIWLLPGLTDLSSVLQGHLLYSLLGDHDTTKRVRTSGPGPLCYSLKQACHRSDFCVSKKKDVTALKAILTKKWERKK